MPSLLIESTDSMMTDPTALMVTFTSHFKLSTRWSLSMRIESLLK